jgi:hypothetical protein
MNKKFLYLSMNIQSPKIHSFCATRVLENVEIVLRISWNLDQSVSSWKNMDNCISSWNLDQSVSSWKNMDRCISSWNLDQSVSSWKNMDNCISVHMELSGRYA